MIVMWKTENGTVSYYNKKYIHYVYMVAKFYHVQFYALSFKVSANFLVFGFLRTKHVRNTW